MKVLIAEDDLVSRRLLEATLAKWGYEVVVTVDGHEAWQVLQQQGAPPLAILDWMMPGVDGLEVCRKVRSASDSQLPYIILLTARDGKPRMVEGLDAGADDYVTKPFDPEELHARIRVGERVLGLQSALADRAHQLEGASSRIKILQGLLPICASCKKIRDDEGCWNELEVYVLEHSEAEFSHSFCPPCVKRLYPDEHSKLFSGETAEPR